jgi:hypothetical protein
MREARMRRRALTWSVTAAVLILAIAVAVRVHRGSGQPPESLPAPVPAPGITTLVRPQCAAIKTTDATGASLRDSAVALVATAHDAACRRDYDGLLAVMETPFGTRSPAEALGELRADDGAPLVVLAQTLETAPISDQGGLIYCHPHGAIAIFARGTLDRPGRFTSFTLTGDSPEASECFELRSSQRASSR